MLTYVHYRVGWQLTAAVAAIQEKIDIDAAVAWVRPLKLTADP
ncbi:MAG: hypothetical protein ACLP0J_27655 [Solirubrobacteraceae bacterium]